MNQAESEAPGPGSAFIIAQLMELILIEILRRESLRFGQEQLGLFAGLADSVTASALFAMHSEPSRNWTVAELARLSMVSRSTFATRFQKRVGMGPIEYLQSWRMALAKDELRPGRRSIGEIALAVGFQPSSAFSAAFTRSEGCSPKRFAEMARDNKRQPATRKSLNEARNGAQKENPMSRRSRARTFLRSNPRTTKKARRRRSHNCVRKSYLTDACGNRYLTEGLQLTCPVFLSQ